MICPSCGAENPNEARVCQNCGYAFYAPAKKKTSGALIAVIAIFTFLILMAALIILPNILNPPHYYSFITIGTNKGSTATTTTWTVTALSGGASLSKQDVYVQVKNADGVFTITTQPLLSVSGFHGFNYSAASAGNYISVGDMLSLDKSLYTQGSTITLVSSGAAGQYCVLTV